MAAEAHVDCMSVWAITPCGEPKRQGRPNEAWKLGRWNTGLSLNDLFVTEAFQDVRVSA